MGDHLFRVLADEINVRAFVCVTTDTSRDICSRHGARPTAAVALARAVTGGVLLGALLKGRERVALKLEGNGPLGKILVEADSLCRVHGSVGNPNVDLPLKDGRFDVAGALGQAGLLTVTKDLLLKKPYQGVVNLQTSEIAEDLAYYLTDSEQTPSAVGLTALPDEHGAIAVAGGFLVQSLPSADETVLAEVSARIGTLPPLAAFFGPEGDPLDVLRHVFGDIAFEVLGRQEVSFFCGCSRDRVEQALVTLGVEEIEKLAAQGEHTEITCEFCRRVYTLSARDLLRLAREKH